MTVFPTTRSKPLPKNNLYLGGELLEKVPVYRYLGVKLDKELNFKIHINTIIKNVSRKLYNLSKMCKFLTTKGCINVYKVMILPFLDISDIFYNSASKSYLSRLQVLQNHAIRIIQRLPTRQNTDEEHNKLHLLKLDQRRKLHILQHANWTAHNGNFSDNRRLPTRAHDPDRKMMIVIKPDKTKFQKSFLFMVTHYWNQLSTVIHKIEQLTTQ